MQLLAQQILSFLSFSPIQLCLQNEYSLYMTKVLSWQSIWFCLIKQICWSASFEEPGTYMIISVYLFSTTFHQLQQKRSITTSSSIPPPKRVLFARDSQILLVVSIDRSIYCCMLLFIVQIQVGYNPSLTLQHHHPEGNWLSLLHEAGRRQQISSVLRISQLCVAVQNFWGIH